MQLHVFTSDHESLHFIFQRLYLAHELASLVRGDAYFSLSFQEVQCSDRKGIISYLR